MSKFVVKKEYEDENEIEVSELFYIFNDNYDFTSEDMDYLDLISDCHEIYNEINDEFICYQIIRIDDDKTIEKNNVPTGDVKGLLKHFIKTNFNEYEDSINKGDDPLFVAEKIIKDYKEKKNNKNKR